MTLNHRYLKIRSLGWFLFIFNWSCHKQSPRTGWREPKLKLPKCNCQVAGWSIMVCFVNVFLSSFNYSETTAYYCATAGLVPGYQLRFLGLKLPVCFSYSLTDIYLYIEISRYQDLLFSNVCGLDPIWSSI